jgi:hypothetical protein
MNNITYSIIDSKKDSDNYISSPSNESATWDEIYLTENKKNDVKTNQLINEENELYARELEYDLNYSVKYLGIILDFYNIKKNKLNKKAIIKKILDFEINIKNSAKVETRKRLFDNFIELKNDQFFSKFIVSNFT